MSDLIQELYEMVTPETISREEAEKRRELDRYYERIETVLSTPFLEGLLAYDSAAYAVREGESFERGFRLGAELMLDILRQDGGRG